MFYSLYSCYLLCKFYLCFSSFLFRTLPAWFILPPFLSSLFLKDLKRIVFFYLFNWLCLVFTDVFRLSQVVVGGGSSLDGAQTSHCGGFSSCRAQARGSPASVVVACTGSRVQAQELWHMSLIAPWHVESSWLLLLSRFSCV